MRKGEGEPGNEANLLNKFDPQVAIARRSYTILLCLLHTNL